MKAAVRSRYGGPEVLTVADLPVPEPGPGELRIRVEAASVGAGVTGFAVGDDAFGHRAATGRGQAP